MKLKQMLAITMMSILSLSVLSGCQSKAVSSDTIRIGSSFALTGDVAVYGKAARNGVALAVKEYNENGGVLGKQIQLFTEDNKADEIEATNAFRKLVDKEKVIAFIGSDISSTSEAISKLAVEKNMPMMNPTATKLSITTLGENVFRACYVDPYQGKVLGEFAAGELKGKTAAILMNSESDYSTGIADAFKEAFESAGGKVVNAESYTSQDKDFKPLLVNIKGNNPDIILIADYYGQVALVSQQIKEVGIQSTLVGPDGWDGVLEQIKNDPSVLEGAYFINHYSPEDPDPVVQSFVVNYKKEYNEDPNALAALGYDAARILFESMIKAGTTDSAQVIAAMKAAEVQGATGTITFGEDRNPVKSVAIIQIKDGKNTLYKKMNP